MIKLIISKFIDKSVDLALLVLSLYLVYGSVHPMHKEAITMWAMFILSVLIITTAWRKRK